MGEGGTHKKPRSKEEQSPDQGGGGRPEGEGLRCERLATAKRHLISLVFWASSNLTRPA